MAKKKVEDIEEVVEEKVEVQQGYAVNDAYKSYSSFLVNNVVVPVVDGKVYVTGKNKECLVKGGYIL